MPPKKQTQSSLVKSKRRQAKEKNQVLNNIQVYRKKGTIDSLIKNSGKSHPNEIQPTHISISSKGSSQKCEQIIGENDDEKMKDQSTSAVTPEVTPNKDNTEQDVLMKDLENV